ncbi:hypothetical protein MRB53_017876 [Persea americana]|uniref:Uncharacterized protein n=1 Tax=Persea americana TaxID=3435 RepID=A0ACC2M6A5_PERAE|nr:hypothetical protein MRB53_017876 [Persea americana]
MGRENTSSRRICAEEVSSSSITVIDPLSEISCDVAEEENVPAAEIRRRIICAEEVSISRLIKCSDYHHVSPKVVCRGSAIAGRGNPNTSGQQTRKIPISVKNKFQRSKLTPAPRLFSIIVVVTRSKSSNFCGKYISSKSTTFLRSTSGSVITLKTPIYVP